jgi:hypothetical protein
MTISSPTGQLVEDVVTAYFGTIAACTAHYIE